MPSWQNRNSRWDLLDIMRACYALRPEGIHWPENEEGLTSFRLEHLTRANGIEHSNAHDAMADVYATIAMAKLVKTAQPRLFEYLLSHRSKQKLMTLIDVPQMKPLVHISGMFGAGAAIPAGLRRWPGIRTTVMRSSWWTWRAIFHRCLNSTAIPYANGFIPRKRARRSAGGAGQTGAYQ